MAPPIARVGASCSRAPPPRVQLLSEGQEIYSGPAREATSYFEQLGHKCPANYNPAEFFADLISVDTSSPEAEASSRSLAEPPQSTSPTVTMKPICDRFPGT